MTDLIHEDIHRPDDLDGDEIYENDPEPFIKSDADAERSLESIAYWERKREESRTHHEKMINKLAQWWRRRTDHFDSKIGWHEAALEFYLNSRVSPQYDTKSRKIELYNGTISHRRKPLKVIQPAGMEQADMVIEQLKRHPSYVHLVESKIVDKIDIRAVLNHHKETGEVPPGLEIERGAMRFVVKLDTKNHMPLS